MPPSRVRVYLGCSLDGCIAGPDHDLSFLEEASESSAEEANDGLGFEAFIEEIGALERPTRHGRGMVQVIAHVPR